MIVEREQLEPEEQPAEPQDDRVAVRPFVPADRDAVERLFHEGLLPGHVDYAPAEADRIREMMKTNRQRMWVAEASGEVVGTIAVVEADRDVGQIHWLRVAPEWQQELIVPQRLTEAAADYAREVGLLKLVLQAPPNVAERVASYYQRAGFEYSRSRDENGRHLLEFYLNLYKRVRTAQPLRK